MKIDIGLNRLDRDKAIYKEVKGQLLHQFKKLRKIRISTANGYISELQSRRQQAIFSIYHCIGKTMETFDLSYSCIKYLRRKRRERSFHPQTHGGRMPEYISPFPTRYIF
ncbi:hypothetical protein ACTFIW_003843 [Dictyostelium discoideum]